MKFSSFKLWASQPKAVCVLGLSQSIWIATAIGACVLAVAASRTGAQAPPGPNLHQMDEAIGKILATDGLYTRNTASQNGQYKSVTEQKYSVTESNGCRLVVVADSHAHTELRAQSKDRDWSEIYRPDFSNMDVANIAVSDPQPPQGNWQVTGYMVRVPVIAGRAAIVASRVDKQANLAADLPPIPALVVYVKSREAADRLAKAFANLATACKVSP